MSTPKDLAILALGKLKKGPPPPEGGSDEGGDYDPAKSSMEAFMKAVKGDDVDAALSAYQDVMANCKADEPAKG